MPVAASASRAIARSSGPFELKRAEVRDAGPSAPSPSRCSRKPGCVSCGTTAICRATARRGSPASGRGRRANLAAIGRSTPASSFEQRRLAAAVRAEQPGQRAAGRSTTADVAQREGSGRPMGSRTKCAGRQRHRLRRRPSRRSEGSGAGWEVSWLAESLAIRSVFPRRPTFRSAYLSDSLTESLRLQWRDRVGFRTHFPVHPDKRGRRSSGHPC